MQTDQISPIHRHAWSDLVLWLGVLLCLLGVGVGGLHLFDTALPRILPSTKITIAVGLICSFAGICMSLQSGRRPGFLFFVFEVLLLILLVSDMPARRFSLFQFEHARLWLAFAGLLSMAMMRAPRLAIGVLALSVLGAFFSFYGIAEGRLLFSDDHPAFLYRLIQLQTHFPWIPFYNPMWNGGVEAREFFPSGILNLFLILSPIVYFIDLMSAYNLIVQTFLFVVAPALAWVAASYLGRSLAGRAMACCLTLTCSLLWYRWALVFGTMGFITSLAFLPLSVLMLVRCVDDEGDLTPFEAILTIVSLVSTLLWSPAALILIPAGLGVLLNIRRLVARKTAIVALMIVMMVVGPSMMLFVKASKVSGFLKNEQPAATTSESGSQDSHLQASKKIVSSSALGRIREHCQSLNPLILALALPGLVLIPGRRQRRMYMITACWLALLGIAGPVVKPQLELDRMLLVLAFFLALPTAGALEEILERSRKGSGGLDYVRWAVAGGVFALSPIFVIKVLSNSTSERIHFATPLVSELAGAIQRGAGEGRTLFAGFILHELDGGHIALLADMTGKPLLASSYQHNRWQYSDIIPEPFRKRGESGVEEYLEIYNIGQIVTHDKFWSKWFRSRPSYRSVWRRGKFEIFERKSFKSSYFLSGNGALLSQDGESASFRVDTPEAVLKFNYYPYFAGTPCPLEPFATAGEINLVRIRECLPGTIIELRAAGPIQRLLGRN
jgi:hypothetical protein